MPIASRANEAASAVIKLLGANPDTMQIKEIAQIIEAAMIDAYRDCTERNTKVAAACCEEDLDKAHKIADEMRRANIALIANLSSLR